nr:polysaccharide deacetylase family protein [Rhizobium sp. Q54]
MINPIPILLYHSIDRNPGAAYSRWVVTPERFETHLALIHHGGFKPITVEAFATAKASGEALPERTVIISFDDGLADFLRFAMPALSKFGFPATLFVTSGYVGGRAGWLAGLNEGDRQMLTWPQVAGLAEAGIEIGAHSVSHRQLDLIGKAQARQEIHGSRKAIEDAIGRAVRTFAYPHGYTNRSTTKIVSEAGFIAACGVRHAFSSAQEDPFRLSRIIIEQSMTSEQFTRLLAGVGLPIAPAVFHPAVFGWRQFRRARLFLETTNKALA